MNIPINRGGGGPVRKARKPTLAQAPKQTSVHPKGVPYRGQQILKKGEK